MFQKGMPDFTNIAIYLEFMSEWVTTLLPATSKIILGSITSVIFKMTIFV